MSGLPTYYSAYQLRNDSIYMKAFLKPYLDAHVTTDATRRYAFILWIILGSLLFFYACWMHLPFRGGTVALRIRKFGLRRWSFRIKARRSTYKLYTPTLFQIVTLSSFFVLVICLSLAGPDLIDPTECLWGGNCSTTPAPAAPPSKRDIATSGWSPAYDTLTIPPNATVAISLWSASNRLGEIAYALCPLVITLASHSWPFGILVTPFLANFAFDKVAFYHKWVGRIIWILSTVHVGLWFGQLVIDKDPFGVPVAQTVWRYWQFPAGMGAYVVLTILVAFTFEPLRTRYYEFFYASHVILSVLFLVGCALHFPKFGYWLYIALGLWVGTRVSQALSWIYINGFPFRKISMPSTPAGSFEPLLSNNNNITHNKDQHSTSSTSSSFRANNIEKVSNNNEPTDEAYELSSKRPDTADSLSSWENVQNQKVNSRNLNDQNHPIYAYGSAGQSSSIQYNDYYYSNNNHHNNHHNGNQISENDHLITPNSGTSTPNPYSFNNNHNNNNNNTTSSYQGEYNAYFYQQQQQQLTNFNAKRAAFEARWDPNLSSIALKPGFGCFEILPGLTLRVTIQTKRSIKWTPGQHCFLTFPSLSMFQSHPFTICNLANVSESSGGGSRLVFLVRSRNGLTKKLWQTVVENHNRNKLLQQEHQNLNSSNSNSNNSNSNNNTGNHHRRTPASANKVIMKANVSRPVGSSARVNWDAASTIFIVCGGTGVSYGISILEHAISAMHTKAQAWGSCVQTSRVVFIWVLRDFSHLSWVSSSLRRCIDISSPAQLRIELHVTGHGVQETIQRQASRTYGHQLNPSDYSAYGTAEELGDFNAISTAPSPHNNLMPPTPSYLKNESRRSSRATQDYMSENDSEDERVDPATQDVMYGYHDSFIPESRRRKVQLVNGNFMSVDATDNPVEEDFVLFDGEQDTYNPADAELSLRLRREGKIRRAKSRKVIERSRSRREDDSDEQRGNNVAGDIINAFKRKSKLFNNNDKENSSKTINELAEDEKQNPSQQQLSVQQQPLNPPYPSIYNNSQYSSSDTSDTFVQTPPSMAGDSSATKLVHVDSTASSLNTMHKTQIHDMDRVNAELSKAEREDLDVIAELAHSYRPNLSKVLDEEKQRSQGRILVACCGPTSLNTHVRKIIKDKIDPSAVARGDIRGDIQFVCEDFVF